MIGCVVGQGLIAKFFMWLARMLRELSRLGSKRMPPVEAEAEEESRPSSPKKSGLSGRMEESGANDGADDVKDMKNFDLSRLVLISAWKKGIYTALPGVLVITFLAFPVVSALVRRLGSNPRGTSRPSQRHAPRLLTTEPPPPRLSPRLIVVRGVLCFPDRDLADLRAGSAARAEFEESFRVRAIAILFVPLAILCSSA